MLHLLTMARGPAELHQGGHTVLYSFAQWPAGKAWPEKGMALALALSLDVLPFFGVTSWPCVHFVVYLLAL